MIASMSQLKSGLSFAREMTYKYIDVLKEWQKRAIEELNRYCKGISSIEEYLDFIKNYNKALLTYEHWKSRVDFYCDEVRRYYSEVEHG